MSNRFPAIILLAVVIIGLANMMSGIVLWVMVGIATVALAGMIAYLVVSGNFTPPTTLIDDVRDSARDVRRKMSAPERSDHDVVD